MIRDYKKEYNILCEDIKRDIVDDLKAHHDGCYRFTLEDRVRVPYAMGTPLISEIAVIDNCNLGFKTALYTCMGKLVCENKEYTLMENDFTMLYEIYKKLYYED